MKPGNIVSRDEWLEARKILLQEEKDFTGLRDQLSRKRRQLPWLKVDTDYVFEDLSGKLSLVDLFEDKSQLIIYHFMYGPNWEEGCPSCSFWADNFNGIDIHLRHRDANLVVVSRAGLAQLQAYRRRMGWDFKWVSSLGNNFNHDYHVSFTAAEMEKAEMFYNFKIGSFPADEAPGISVFYRSPEGEVFHTYSCYARGLDMLNGAYHYLDLLPKGRDEDDLDFTMAWLRRRDEYDD
jgi:predicted dithiol-disulfide oxidoreductase (DUF899 family)